jgi:hypothetical protein
VRIVRQFYWITIEEVGGKQMNWRWVVVSVSVLLVAAPSISHATFLDGNQLYEICGGTTKVNEASCLAYIDGTTDTLEAMRWGENKPPDCLPAGSTGKQVRDVVMQYLSSHPQDRAKPAAPLVLMAVFTAWPACHL